MRRIFFIVTAAAIILRLLLAHGIKSATAGTVLVIPIGSMVWFSDVWAEYGLSLGFWESKAIDFKHPQRSAGAVAFLGWVFLILLGIAVFLA